MNADLLPYLLAQLTQKETPPPADDNTLIQKMIAPNDSVSMDDSNVAISIAQPSTFKWGGDVSGVYQPPGWKWCQGVWASE